MLKGKKGGGQRKGRVKWLAFSLKKVCKREGKGAPEHIRVTGCRGYNTCLGDICIPVWKVGCIGREKKDERGGRIGGKKREGLE